LVYGDKYKEKANETHFQARSTAHKQVIKKFIVSDKKF